MSTDFLTDMASAWLQDRSTEQLRQRRDRFAVDYGIADKPAMVLQVLPTVIPTGMNLQDEAVGKALRRQGLQPEVAWWREFASSDRIQPVFDGIASNTRDSDGGWGAELHSDAHLIAGVWTFPRNGESGVAVAVFFEQIFADFARLAAGVYDAAVVSGRCAVTCAILNAPKLPLKTSKSWGYSAPAPRRDTLEWPVDMTSSVDGLGAACEGMKLRFRRAYGVFEFD